MYKFYLDREDNETPYLILYNGMACWVYESELTTDLSKVLRKDSRPYGDVYVRDDDIKGLEFLGEFEDLDTLKMLAMMEM